MLCEAEKLRQSRQPNTCNYECVFLFYSKQLRYSALGHRPHAEEAAMQAMSPASASLIDSLPKVSVAEQQEQLVKFISKDDPFALEVLSEYTAMFLRMKGTETEEIYFSFFLSEILGLDIDLALRRLLYHFKLPKESQQISRVIGAFATAFFRLHANSTCFDHESTAFAPSSVDATHHYGPGEFISWTDAESVELIVFALVMLNGDLHNPENTEKMTRQQFIDNIKRSGATVVLGEQTLSDVYSRIQFDPISFDNKLVPFPEAIRKCYVECKVKGVAGVRMWTKVWAVLCENYDVTDATTVEERNQRSGGYGILYLCKSSRDESSVLLTFPLKRSVSLTHAGKREFSLSHDASAAAAPPGPSAGGLRGVLGMGGGSGTTPVEEARVKFRCKTDGEYHQWVRAFQYLLTGGYGFWYPWEHRDFSLDWPEEPTTIGGTKKTRRRRKNPGTLKKKKKAAQTDELCNSPRNNETDLLSAENQSGDE
jgi:hypothetical protein